MFFFLLLLFSLIPLKGLRLMNQNLDYGYLDLGGLYRNTK